MESENESDGEITDRSSASTSAGTSAVIDITECPAPNKKAKIQKKYENNTSTHAAQKKKYAEILRKEPDRITYVKCTKTLVENEEYDKLFLDKKDTSYMRCNHADCAHRPFDKKVNYDSWHKCN